MIKCEKVFLYDSSNSKAESLAESVGSKAITVKSIRKMMQLRPNIIVEAASQQAAREYLPIILKKNIDVVVMSVGALLDMKINSPKLHVPSGAIGGLDAISSADLAGVTQVTLTTRKNPRALEMNNTNQELVYEGNAEEAVKRFPREMNVAATLALTVPHGKIKVRVISDPSVERNVHEIQVRWKHGEMVLKFANDSHPANPGTSALAAWSAIKLLRDLLGQT